MADMGDMWPWLAGGAGGGGALWKLWDWMRGIEKESLARARELHVRVNTVEQMKADKAEVDKDIARLEDRFVAALGDLRNDLREHRTETTGQFKALGDKIDRLVRTGDGK
jgi:hypothetical protein